MLQEARMTFVEGLKLSQTSSTSNSHDPAAFRRIPLLDFSLTRDPGTKQEFLQSLRNAIINVGFFYVKNTTVSTEIQENLVKKGIELFDLPLDEKLKIEMVNSKHFLGYVRLGTEITAMKPDHREQADVSRLSLGMSEC
jgi:isopenicillin N synthase-like dioxygenase